MRWQKSRIARRSNVSGRELMMLKIVSLFLIFIAVLAMFGKLSLLLPRKMRQIARKCPKCGRHRIGKGDCPCGKA